MAKNKTSIISKQQVTFTYRSASAKSVLLAGDFTRWQQAPLELSRGKDGTWKTTVPLPPGVYEYKMLVDGKWEDDPKCARRRPNQFGGENCVCTVSEKRALDMAA